MALNVRSRASLPKKTLDPIHPNKGIEAAYRKRLEGLVHEMHKSILYWVTAAYKANEPLIAMDELPASVLKKLMKRLSRRWQKKFNEFAPKLAAYYSKAAADRVSGALEKMLKEAGIAVEWKMTPIMRDVMNATISEQVGLIKSIPQQYLIQVEGLVMRSVTTGRDLKQLTDDLKARYDITRKRAILIARDQNNKATATLTRVRQQEAGITHAIWMHSHGGKEPRPSHVRAGKEQIEYDVTKGWFDPDEQEWIWPGTLINCRCVCRPVLPWRKQ